MKRIDITTDEWKNLLKEFNYRCVRCGLENCHLDKDHIRPHYQGGGNKIDNLQPLCAWRNASKGPENINWINIRREHGWTKFNIKLPKKHPYNLQK